MTPRTAREQRKHPTPTGAGCFRLCAALVGAFLAVPALAARPVSSVEGGVGFLRLDYAERGPTGGVLDRESGILPVATFALEFEPARWFARLAANAGAGSLRYDGHTQSLDAAFDDLPVESTSGARLLAVELRAGTFVDRGRRLALYGGAAYRDWERKIASTSVVSRTGSTAQIPELDEHYSWVELQGGVRCTFVRSALADWQLDARLSEVMGGRVVVDQAGGDVTLHLGDRLGGRLALAARVAVAPRWHLLVEGHWALWRFGASPVDASSLLYEPESESQTAGLEARIGATF